MKIKNFKLKIYLLLILLIGSIFRFYNVNWDQGFHLHPDERFLTMVGNAMKLPVNFYDYINPSISTFNPANLNFRFFVYGTFPLIMNKILALILNNDDYFSFTIQGRILSAFFDLLIIVFIYKTVELFEEKYNLSKQVKYWAGFFYAISVLPIQLSHFFAVDTFLSFFMFSSFYYAVKYSFKTHIEYLIISAFLFGLAVASKISAVVILPLLLFFLLKKIKPFETTFIGLLFLLTSYVTVRIADPYMFQHSNISNPQLSNLLIQSLKTLSSWSNKNVWYPPAVQWITKPPVIFSFINLIIFGIGIPYFVLFLIGTYSMFNKFKIELLAIITWMILFFLYQSIQFAKPMRYLIVIYPFLAIFVGFGFLKLTEHKSIIYKSLIIFLTLLYPLAFLSIYVNKNTRVAASEWIYQNFPNNSFILWEHWDDPLPLLAKNNEHKQFLSEALPVFDIDSQEKMNKIYASLKKADYYILSSNRSWGSIPTVPDKYPLMSKFYKELFSEKLGYKKIKEFTSYPSLKYLGIPFELPDDWADESFTVYDHPKVIIFKNYANIR